ncbi:MAG: TIGR02117 family protein [Chitinophagaceae bacterium]|nr:MAG: TIGR02117 family protein [Chitinophagaceae bacterium]
MLYILKRITKCVGYCMLFIISAVSLYLLSAFCLSRLTVREELLTSGEISIYIKTNGVHTDIVVPVKNEIKDWSSELAFSNTGLPDTSRVNWLALGWGDKGFYLETPTWNDLKFTTAFKAAFALGRTALHATYYSDVTASESCKEISINKAQYKRLVAYLRASFKEDSNGKVQYIATNANYGNNDAFYEAKGKYSMFKTCNSWANSALKSCGQRACLWTAFDTPIFLKYSR